MSFKKLLPIFFVMLSFGAKANNMLIQNVTTTDNNTVNKTIQVQFDMSWDNSWRDAINWDAAWVFIKFKDANGLWQHAQLNLAGFANGTGTANTVKVTSDKVGAWVYRSALGSGTFNSTSMQLQWNYGLNGLDDASGLEVRVFATEMVYVPEGEFNCAKEFLVPSNGNLGIFNAPGGNHPVINNFLSPTIYYFDGTSSSTIKIKGNQGIDTNNDNIVDNITYPIGLKSFYESKYELSEQQYSDFLNTLTLQQITTLGIAGIEITSNNGIYFSSSPNRACGNSNSERLFSFGDWSCMRPLSFLEFNKSSYGPLQPVKKGNCYYGPYGYPAWGSSGCPTSLGSLINVGFSGSANSSRTSSGASYYGIMDLTYNANEPMISLNSFSFSTQNGDGFLRPDGLSDIENWRNSVIIYVDQTFYATPNSFGFRYVRSAE